MQSDTPDPKTHVNFEEVSRLYDLLDGYGNTLEDKTERSLNVMIFEAFHRWEVQKIVKREEVSWPDDFNFTTEEIEWVWLETGSMINCLDDDGGPCEEFGLHGEYDKQGNFVIQPKTVPIPDYIESLDEALELKRMLVFRNLRIDELVGNSFTLWRAALVAKDCKTLEEEAATPSVAVLKVVLKALMQSPARLNWLKFGSPMEEK